MNIFLGKINYLENPIYEVHLDFYYEVKNHGRFYTFNFQIKSNEDLVSVLIDLSRDQIETILSNIDEKIVFGDVEQKIEFYIEKNKFQASFNLIFFDSFEIDTHDFEFNYYEVKDKLSELILLY